MIVITGASGQLGRLVIAELLRKIPATQIVATVRDPAKLADLAALGVEVRRADYTDPASLEAAFAGAEKLLLISSSEVGQREAQHANAIAAARKAGVGLVAYTSILRADNSPLDLAREHLATEKLLQASGLPHVILRNSWYTENYLHGIATALQHGVMLGAAGTGRIASAARADYAAAAAAVLLAEGQAGKVYELAGDESYTLAEFAAEVARQSGKPVAYRNLAEAEYRETLKSFGLPEAFAGLLAQSDAGASQGGLFDDGHQLSRLIGRPTTPLAAMVKQALAQ